MDAEQAILNLASVASSIAFSCTWRNTIPFCSRINCIMYIVDVSVPNIMIVFSVVCLFIFNFRNKKKIKIRKYPVDALSEARIGCPLNKYAGIEDMATNKVK